ncbi:hypothetical protein FRC16_007003, partial [Serendipita sp. 398]
MSVTEQSIEKLKLTSKEELCYSRLNDALEPYARAVTSCWSSCSCVRLYCTVPTCPPRNADLQDLKDLQSRCFGFMHALVKLLRTSGVYASYHLTFAPTSQVVVRALEAQQNPDAEKRQWQEDEAVAIERAKAHDP